VFFEVNLKITLNNIHLNYVIIYLQLTYYTKVQVKLFNNSSVLIAYRDKIGNKLFKCLPPESTKAWTRRIMHCRTLAKVPGRLQTALQPLKIRCWTVCLFHFLAGYTRPSVLGCTDWDLANVGAAGLPRKLSLLRPSLFYLITAGVEVIYFHLITLRQTPQAIGLLWTRDRPVAETSTWQHKHCTRQTSMPPVGFEPTIPASARPQTYALDRAATGVGEN
jgi:hypothetical protein